MTTTPTTTDTGGQAFPNAHPTCPGDGMTLLDYFAARADEHDIAEHMPDTVGECLTFESERGFYPTREWARYEHAAAMIAEKRRRESSSC